MKSKFTFDAIGREPYPEEIEWAETFRKKYSGESATRREVPSWMYENVDDIFIRVAQVEGFMYKTTRVANNLEVKVSNKMFADIKMDKKFSQTYQFYAKANIVYEEDSQLKDKQWLMISRTLFVVEE